MATRLQTSIERSGRSAPLGRCARCLAKTGGNWNSTSIPSASLGQSWKRTSRYIMWKCALYPMLFLSRNSFTLIRGSAICCMYGMCFRRAFTHIRTTWTSSLDLLKAWIHSFKRWTSSDKFLHTACCTALDTSLRAGVTSFSDTLSAQFSAWKISSARIASITAFCRFRPGLSVGVRSTSACEATRKSLACRFAALAIRSGSPGSSVHT